ncbi:glutathione peroxidase 1-like [Tubulanus polymorphus]|uniref:glutathione peroxidase 1-like n=1 Tax=Tubulanus polymorphus TaxID=672921 RepID=UPI003DA37435
MNEMILRFADKLVILAFPCNQFGHQNNFTTEVEMLNIMKYVRPGNDFEPNFKIFELVDVNGSKCNAVFKFLRESIPLPNDDPMSMTDAQNITWNPVTRSDIAWNFEKFLIDPDGRPQKRFSSKFQTSALIEDIRQLAQKVEPSKICRNKMY